MTDRRPLSPVDAALIAEACSKSDLVWVRPAPGDRARGVWHVWHDDAVALVLGGGEQDLPDLAREVEVVARSKDNGARVVAFLAETETLQPRGDAWERAAFALGASRLNALDPPRQNERWAASSRIVLLRPFSVGAAGAGDDDSPAEAAPPPGGPGTTLTRRPYHLGSRRRRALRRRR